MTAETAARHGRAMKATAFGALVALVLAVGASAGGALAQDTDIEADARTAIETVFDALTSGDAGQVRPLLAPEFQIVRSDGAAYDKEEYLARSIPHIDSKPTISDLVVTRNGDIVVTRFRLGIEEELDGKKAESNAPQLIIFRITPEAWQVVASANFARLSD
ncbi:MAG: nuclear transport factor 2 family protein [Bauldia sp.]|nr:nuclear transport factor 2 family protein [Bauldia sp.]